MVHGVVVVVVQDDVMRIEGAGCGALLLLLTRDGGRARRRGHGYNFSARSATRQGQQQPEPALVAWPQYRDREGAADRPIGAAAPSRSRYRTWYASTRHVIIRA